MEILVRQVDRQIVDQPGLAQPGGGKNPEPAAIQIGRREGCGVADLEIIDRVESGLEQRLRDGIPVPQATWDEVGAVAERFGVPLPEVI